MNDIDDHNPKDRKSLMQKKRDYKFGEHKYPGLKKWNLSPEVFIYYLDEVPSVLDVSWDLIQNTNNFGIFTSLIAASQKEGRGRMGRVWESPVGHIYVSLRLPFANPFLDTLASVALSLFLSEAIEEILGFKTSIKWPNDILYQGKKCGGILIENKKGHLLAGIGLNLNDPPPLSYERHPLAPEPCGLPVGMEPPFKLWNKLVRHIICRYNDDFIDPLPSWREGIVSMTESRLYGIGKPVEVLEPRSVPSPPDTKRLTGIIKGLDSSGALIVLKGDDSYRVWSGTALSSQKEGTLT
jgi:BirA family biotin operon repressor/biotin-[acetyl-CoA-carboxylase] ligase